MKPVAWSYDAILTWESFGDGADERGTWVAGTTTFNQVSQGRTPGEALQSLELCLAATARWDLDHGRTESELFRIHRSSDTPIASMQEQFSETRITAPDEATDESARYIISRRITDESVRAIQFARDEQEGTP